MHSDSGAARGRGFSGVRATIKFVARRAAQRGNRAVHVLYWQALFYYRKLGETYAKGRALRWALLGSSIVYCTVRVDLDHSFCCTASTVFLLRSAVDFTARRHGKAGKREINFWLFYSVLEMCRYVWVKLM